MTYEVIIEGRPHRVELVRGAQGRIVSCRVDGDAVVLDAVVAERDVLSLLIGGRSYDVKREHTATIAHVTVDGVPFAVEVRDPRAYRSRRASAAKQEGPERLVSPMPGKVVRVLAPAGTPVEAGQGVIVVEAMKMQNEIKSPKKGVVQKIVAAEGAPVNAGEVLAVVE